MKTIIEYYSHEISEDARLQDAYGRLEYLRTLDILERYLPPAPAAVADVGGATGAYATWLRERGYAVHLIDPVPGHVALAHQALEAAPGSQPWSAEVGLGESLPFDDASMDAVLCMGPLYHLQEREARLTVLREVGRILRTGGPVFVAAISRFASLIDGLAEGFIEDPQFDEIVRRDLDSGRHVNTTDNPVFFTDAFFHRPEDLAEEVAEAGLLLERLVAIEGPGWVRKDLPQVMVQHENRNQLLGLLRAVEEEASLMGASPHFFALARSPS